MAYLYRHIRLDKNEPFYIGISKKDDAGFKRAYSAAKSKRNKIWMSIAEKTKYEVEILFYDVDIEFVKKKEIELIQLYGRICCKTGTLANIGGGGEPLFDPPDYIRKKLSENNKGEKNYWYGRTHSEETRRKISEAHKGKKRPLKEETKIKIGLANKGKTTWTKGTKQTEAGLKRSGVNHPTNKGPILCYDLKGEFIKEFSSTREAVNHFGYKNTNDITRVLKGERLSWHGHTFFYKDERYAEAAEKTKQMRVKMREMTPKKKSATIFAGGVNHPSYKGPILCFDMEGNFVREFVTTRECADYFGAKKTGNVARVLKGKSLSWLKHKFTYKNIDK
jgi:hypothetical protein